MFVARSKNIRAKRGRGFSLQHELLIQHDTKWKGKSGKI